MGSSSHAPCLPLVVRTLLLLILPPRHRMPQTRTEGEGRRRRPHGGLALWCSGTRNGVAVRRARRGQEENSGSQGAGRGIVCVNGWVGVIATQGFCGRGDMRPCGAGGEGSDGDGVRGVGADGEWDGLVNAGE